jgi:hypothetical protein
MLLASLPFIVWLLADAPSGLPARVAVQPAAPAIYGTATLSALPSEYATGIGGPITRLALDIANFDPRDPASRIECRYPDGLRYRCQYAPAEGLTPRSHLRINVMVPDLGRGSHVLLQLFASGGEAELEVDLTNPPKVVHEIESLPLPDGGRAALGSNGKQQPVLDLLTTRASTAPASALTLATTADACDRVRAEWGQVSASDAVFASQFGPVNGTVLLVHPVQPATIVSKDTLPLWLVTYPASATRVQFIAHYELVYRVGVCRDRVIAWRALPSAAAVARSAARRASPAAPDRPSSTMGAASRARLPARET